MVTGLLDVRQLSLEQRHKLALRVQVAEDFKIPELRYWNYSPCAKHKVGWIHEYFEKDELKQTVVTDRPKPGCQFCGVLFRQHQRVGVMWAYLRGRGLIADVVGTGKMITGAALVAMLKETGELNPAGRVVICPRPASLFQWQRELARVIPCIHTVMVDGAKPKKTRISKYLQPWEVLLVGPQVLHNDYDALMDNFEFSTLITDDVDALRHRDTVTAATLKRFGRNCDRMIVMTGTPLQKKIQELHSILDPLGGLEIFGTEAVFLNRYANRTKTRVKLWHPKTAKSHYTKIEVTGHKNIAEFITKMSPMVIRRTFDDIKDSTLPIIMPPNKVWFDLHPAQRAKYEELKKGILEIIRVEGDRVTRARAMASVHTAAMICGGLSVLGEADGPGTSVKFDWLEEQLTDGDLATEKVVVFVKYKNGIRTLQARLDRLGIGYETIWGEEPNKAIRAKSQERFWYDKNCRVLLGTEAIEQSLNFQCARQLVYIDLIPNPGRMEQVAGRIRRDGSEFPHVFLYYLLINETHEMRLLPKLEAEQALINAVWDSKSELFDQLTPLQMLLLIAS